MWIKGIFSLWIAWSARINRWPFKVNRGAGPEQTIPARKDKVFVLSNVPSILVLTKKICCQLKTIALAFWGLFDIFVFFLPINLQTYHLNNDSRVIERQLMLVMRQRSQRLHVSACFHTKSQPIQLHLLPFLGFVFCLSRCNTTLLRHLYIYLTLSALLLFSWGTGVEVRKKIWPVCKGL